MLLLRSIQNRKSQPSDTYPFNLLVIQTLDQLEFSSSVTFFVGENGCGKSTLMRAIASAANVRVIGQENKPTSQSDFNPLECCFYQKNLIYGIILKIREKTEYYFKKRT